MEPEDKPNVYVSPFISSILKSLAQEWLKQIENPGLGDPVDLTHFDENDSFRWTVRDMKAFVERIK